MSQTPPPSTLLLGFYSRRPATVAAVRVTQDNATMVAEWCRGAVTWVGALPRVSLDTPFGTAVVVTGDWVVRDETGEFRPSTTPPSPAPTSPSHLTRLETTNDRLQARRHHPQRGPRR